jgi:hypothetical protein
MDNIYEDLSQDDLVTRLIEAETLLKQVSETFTPVGRDGQGTISDTILLAIVSYRRRHRV